MTIEKLTPSDKKYEKSDFHTFLTVMYCHFTDEDHRVPAKEMPDFSICLQYIHNHTDDVVVKLTAIHVLLTIDIFLDDNNLQDFLTGLSDAIDMLED